MVADTEQLLHMDIDHKVPETELEELPRLKHFHNHPPFENL